MRMAKKQACPGCIISGGDNATAPTYLYRSKISVGASADTVDPV
jgi:hypothetical protein